MRLLSWLLASGLLSATGTLAQVTVPSSFTVGAKFQIVIHNTIDPDSPLEPADALVWDIDLFHLARTPEVANHIRSTNPSATILCYFNAGLAQTSDCDYPRWDSSGLLGNPYDITDPDLFPDERWINIKNATAREWIKWRISLARDLGCDGVDPDNIDGFLNDYDGDNGTGWSLSEDDYVAFVTELAEHAHGLTTLQGNTMLIGQKNAPELIGRVKDVLDFAVLEDCRTINDEEDYEFCTDFKEAYIDEGKPVFSIEYPSTIGENGECWATGASEDEYNVACEEGAAGFSTVLKIQGEGELNGCTQYCDGGEPGTGVVVTPTDPERDGDPCPNDAIRGESLGGQGTGRWRWRK
ncbi:hypothetical protein VTJ49DRAFT_6407 [Mycothermus thermophilus]|uniref:alpha-galactosidase n=1 Tax=Humicola insolens TaxID=85995 RepID=A0ABR3VQR2_HUMIN